MFFLEIAIANRILCTLIMDKFNVLVREIVFTSPNNHQKLLRKKFYPNRTIEALVIFLPDITY